MTRRNPVRLAFRRTVATIQLMNPVYQVALAAAVVAGVLVLVATSSHPETAWLAAAATAVTGWMF